MNRIHTSLQRVFQRHRIVFWYDATQEWKGTFESFEDSGVTKLSVSGNEFGTKVRVVREPNADTKFLIYVPTSRPFDADNWLLDILLQGYQYKADKASLALEEAGLPQDFLSLAEEHAAYFNNAKRVEALKERVTKEDQERDIRLKMMAVLASAEADVDSLLLRFLAANEDEGLTDPVVDAFSGASLVAPFWREVEKAFTYNSQTPSLRDFAVSLFRSANPLDTQVKLHPHAKVFMQRWKDSQAYAASFRRWSRRMESELNVTASLGTLDEGAGLGDWDTFELFEKFTLHRLCQSFNKGGNAATMRATIQQRRSSFWLTEHKHGYAVLEQAVELRELLAAVELNVDSLEAGLQRYTNTWWRIDLAYRRCSYHLRLYGQVNIMEQIAQWVEKAYVNNYLLPLTDRWSDQVKRLETWSCPSVISQRRFFDAYVRPVIAKGQKIFVVVSDALRYEVAAEFAQRLKAASRWTADLDFVLGSLPSYTQLGMASLLPGRKWTIDPIEATVSLDGRSTKGTPNRAEILRLACDGRAVAISAEEFQELNTKTDGRALMRDNDVIYIFHNHIDKTGDSVTTEAWTFEAVEKAFEELDTIIKKIANINGTNMLLTADHGFLFQQTEVPDSDMLPLPVADELTCRNRRFLLGKGIVEDVNVKVFTSAQLGVEGDFTAAFPLSLGRFPLQGSGKRYVHGGTSLQEVVVPVLRIHKARTDDTGRVEVELMRVPAKITTGQVSVSLFQDRAAVGKVLPRTLRVGLFAKDGSSISEMKTVVFDSAELEARQRETSVVLMLSHTADAFNNQEVELRLEETLPGTSQRVVYKGHSLKLQKPFTSDFDES